MTLQHMLTARAVSKYYGKKCVLNVADLKLHEGEALLVSGANGSGKSTFLSLLVGLTKPDQGEIIWHSQSPLTIAYLPQTMMGFSDHSVHFNELLLGLVFGVHRPASLPESKARAYFKSCSKDALGTLSGGYRRLFAIERVCLSGADILVLDEPLSQLDEDRVGDLIALIKATSGSVKAIIATQPSSHTIHKEFLSIWNRQLYLESP